ncbi:hypothetical protein DFA_01833 [Cavenderia fasciculata]|uniref:Uncharacterized protein n=1 Tax=Cavenderia fasciculata TaxID=261658 RepID=F4PUY5_CACFS|nr:uncharacterized protein DFA_01833 [Cavenderia fasciculata]EGG21947.1 hypothetical protein DFA_01833 [Cavenderia fasciculata]|eukprot:XP_004359798.1 hypothetical protein DFA_01833 [Cavenderia fasciculata]
MDQQQQQQQLSQYLDQVIFILLFKDCAVEVIEYDFENRFRYANEIKSLASVCKRWFNTIKIALKLMLGLGFQPV